MRIAMLALILLTASSNSVPPPSLLRGDAPVFEIETMVAPAGSTNGPYDLLEGKRVPKLYTCSAWVYAEPGGRRVWGVPELLVKPGEVKNATTRLGELTMTLTARVDAKREGAHTTVEITRQGKTVALQRSSVSLIPR